MLVFSLREGEFAVIGGAIVRLTQVKSAHAVQLAICVADGVPITRLDAWGNVVNTSRRIAAMRSAADDPAVKEGTILVVLSCGHEVTLGAATVEILLKAGNTHLDCHDCRRHAAELKAKVKQNFNSLGPPKGLRGSSCP